MWQNVLNTSDTLLCMQSQEYCLERSSLPVVKWRHSLGTCPLIMSSLVYIPVISIWREITSIFLMACAYSLLIVVAHSPHYHDAKILTRARGAFMLLWWTAQICMYCANPYMCSSTVFSTSFWYSDGVNLWQMYTLGPLHSCTHWDNTVHLTIHTIRIALKIALWFHSSLLLSLSHSADKGHSIVHLGINTYCAISFWAAPQSSPSSLVLTGIA